MQPVVDLNNTLGYVGMSTQFAVVVLFCVLLAWASHNHGFGLIIGTAGVVSLPVELILHNPWGVIAFYFSFIVGAIASVQAGREKGNKDSR